MRRNKKAWQEKLDSLALAYLDAHRQTRGIFQIPTGDLRNVIHWVEEHKEEIRKAYKKFPKPPEKKSTGTVKLERNFLRLMGQSKFLEGIDLKAGENELPLFMAEILKMAQKLAHHFEKKPGNRAMVYFAIPLCYVLFRPVVEDLRKKQFGPGPLDATKIRMLTAMCLEIVANLFRGRFVKPKGKINQELIHLVKFIQEHQTYPMTARDIHEALAYAGVSVPSGHTWDVWLQRAREKGWIDKSTRI